LIPLSDGRLLCIASREIVLPDGTTYDLSGVNPNVLVRREEKAEGRPTQRQPLPRKCLSVWRKTPCWTGQWIFCWA